MSRRQILIFTAGLALGGVMFLALPASAQSLPAHRWSHCTTLHAFMGPAFASGEARPTFGGAVGWGITNRVELEGTGAWILPRNRDEAFAAELKLLANLTRPRRVVPFVGGGIGLYRSSFDRARGPMPDFYQRRGMGPSLGSSASFTDPSFVLAGGANFFTGPHLSIRPDLSARFVTRESHTYGVTMATVYVTYHFGKHDVTR